jgi:phospholipid/cholesterol/gamma-HCH transport system ATP-binding protein
MNQAQTIHGISVQVKDLWKRFKNNPEPALKGVSFEVNPGEIFVIMGPSGSGKSVLLKHIVGLEPVEQGTITLNGEALDSCLQSRKYRIAMVFQTAALLESLTVAENVGLYLSEHRLKPPQEIHQIVTEKLRLVGLIGVEDKFPSELSGGMRKRVAIARALVIEPQLILYDEPTSELDPISAAIIAGEIVKLRKRLGATSIVVTHDRDLAFAIADRIALLYQGRILAMGTPVEVKMSPNPEVQRFLNIEINLSEIVESHEKHT